MKELIGHQLLLPAFSRWSDKVAFHDGEHHGTFAEHGEAVLRLTSALRDLGLDPGERFAVLSMNSHQYLELYHAAFLGAGIVTPLNLRLAGPELQFILADSACKVVFVDTAFAEHFDRNVAPVRADLPLQKVVLIGDGDVPHDLRYDDLVASGDAVVPREPQETDAVVLMYTGGTTGLAKGAVLDQRAEILNLYHIGLQLGFDESRVYLHQTPMFHAASMGGVLGIPATGATSVFLPLFDPAPVIDLVQTHRVDWTMMVPTMIAMVLDHPNFSPERFASMRDLVYGASPMPAALLDRLRDTLPRTNLWQGYGMTESASVLTFLTAQDHRRDGEILRSAGRPAMGVRLRIEDADGNELPVGENGEICAKAGNMMQGYWRRPEQTEEAFRGGWYHTGDEGHLDAEGYVYLVDRVKDMIVTGGENVYSIEVENAISTHPAVAQVAVIGIPSDEWGEQVHAIVVVSPGHDVTVEEIQQHARRSIAGYKVPKSVELRREPLPLSGALKPLKRELRRPYWDHLDAGVH